MKMFTQIVLTLWLTVRLAYPVHGQNAEKSMPVIQSSEAKFYSLKESLAELSEYYKVHIVSDQNLVDDRMVQLLSSHQSLETDLSFLLSETGLHFKRANKDLVVIIPELKKNEWLASSLVSSGSWIPNSSSLMNLEIKLDQRLFGKVISEKGDPIPGASVVVVGTTKGASTDAEGNYSITLAAGAYSISVSSIGFESITQQVTIGDADQELNFSLKESASQLSEVVILGSRGVTPRTSTTSPVPIDAITTKELRSFSQVNIGDILNYVAPSFNSNRQTVTDGTDHLDPASLRGLGPDQVLVLVNGKRRHTSALVNINGSVGRGSVGTDMNVIPVAAIERIEVLRDGAAAQYGSDAIAGVINVVLKKDYDGFTASLTTGTHMTNMNYRIPNLSGGYTSKTQSINDGHVVQLDISKGLRLGKNGSLTITAQYNDRGNTNRSGLDNAPTIYLGSSGSFPSTPTGQTQSVFRNQLITDDATLVAQNKYDRHNMVFGNSSARNMGIFLNGSLPLSEKSELYFAGGYTYRTGKAYGNVRLPASRTQQPLNSDGSLYYPNGFLPAISPTIQDPSLIVGFKTKLNKWRMDVSNTIGNNSFAFRVEESGNATLPNGVVPTTFDAGKLSFTQNTFNLDFARTYDQLGMINNFNIAFGGEFRYENYRIKEGELNSYSGTLKTVPTAPLTIGGPAAGTTTALPGAQVFPGFQPGYAVDKSRTSQGLYADVEGELFKRLLIGVAGRFENFSDFGSNLSGKFAARYKISSVFSLRGSVSTGFRAPSLHQRYFQSISTQFVSGIPSNTLTVNNDNEIARVKIGVDALRPEISVGGTVGITASFGKTSLTVDAYQIDITSRIVYSGAFSRSLLGFASNEFVGVNNVNFFANAANTSTRGLDIVASNKTDIGRGSLTITLGVNFNENKVTGINSTPLIDSPSKNDPNTNPNTWFKNLLFDRQQRSRIEVLQPRNKVNLSLVYSISKFNVTARVVRFGEITYIHNIDPNAKKSDGTYWNADFARDANGAAYIDQTFAPIFVTDLTLGYKINKNLNLAIGANNLLDVYPDQLFIDPRNSLGSIDYSSARDASNRGRLLYLANQGGFNGRFVFARLTATF